MKPEYIARAPGRVNLIGEHIDYMGYGVLPFALEQDCLMAFCFNKDWDKIEIHHLNSNSPKTHDPSVGYPS
jgi:galactokinase